MPYIVPMILSYRSKPLELFALAGDSSKLPVPAAHHQKVSFLVQALDAATQPDDMHLPGFGFHGLQGKPKRYAVKVTVNYRLTFGWDDGNAVLVDLEDYH